MLKDGAGTARHGREVRLRRLDAAAVLGKVPSALRVSTAGRGLRSGPALKAAIPPWIGYPIDGPLRWVAP